MKFGKVGLGGLSALLVVVGLLSCLKSEDKNSGGDSLDVTGSWTGSRSGWTTVSGGCGADTSSQALAISLVLDQSGFAVTGIVMAVGQPDTFQIANGVLNGDSLTFNVLASDSSCPQQSDRFSCKAGEALLACINIDVHCDEHCPQSSGNVVHTIKETYTLAKQ